MPTPNQPHDSGRDLGKAPGKDLSKVPNRDEKALHSIGEGYEVTDVSVSGVNGFLAALGVVLLIFFVFAFGMGKVMNTVLRHNDGPANPFQQGGGAQTGSLAGSKLGPTGMASSPALEQQQLHQMTQAFPTPRLQTDDGDQDLADMHQREDLLLNNYTYVDQAQSKVRIPIDRAIELVAQRGLPVAPAVANAAGPRMYGDTPPVVQVPLTSGFARTGYEQERESAAGAAGEQASSSANNY